MRFNGDPEARKIEIPKTGFRCRDVGVLTVTVVEDGKETSVPAEE